MLKISEKEILQKLVSSFPRPLNLYDFQIEPDDKQAFLNLLYELKQRCLIDASFQISRSLNTYGLPLAVINILITKEGREFMEKKESAPASYNQSISINNASGHLNISGRDINISNSIDANKFIEVFLDNVEKSDLHPKEKEGIVSSFKNMISSTTPSIVAGLIVEAVKAVATKI